MGNFDYTEDGASPSDTGDGGDAGQDPAAARLALLEQLAASNDGLSDLAKEAIAIGRERIERQSREAEALRLVEQTQPKDLFSTWRLMEAAREAGDGGEYARLSVEWDQVLGAIREVETVRKAEANDTHVKMLIAAKLRDGVPQSQIENEMVAVIEELEAYKALDTSDPIVESPLWQEFEERKWTFERGELGRQMAREDMDNENVLASGARDQAAREAEYAEMIEMVGTTAE